MGTTKKIAAFGLAWLAALGAPKQARAFDTESKFALPLSASVGIGTMESSDMGSQSKSRKMNALSFDVLPSYRIGKWLFGPHLDYRWLGQMDSLSSAGGTNLKGNGWLVGIGARRDFSDRFFVQGAVNFLGAYDLTKDTAAMEDDRLKSPLGLRVKVGYVFIQSIPALTFDTDLQYLMWKTIHIAGVDKSATFNQLMASVGITWHFGFGSKSAAAQETPASDLSKIEGVQKAGKSLRLSMTGASFESSSVQLSEESKTQFTQAAETIAKSDVSVRVEGYTDSSGNLTKNHSLSQARADSVKAFLVEHGVRAERISARGFGPSKPIADNKTKEGRAKNRRVEIYLDEREGEK